MTPLMPGHFSLKTCFSKKNTIRYSIHSHDNLLPLDIIIHSYLFSRKRTENCRANILVLPLNRVPEQLTTESSRRKVHKSCQSCLPHTGEGLELMNRFII